VTVTWQSVAGVRYLLECSTNLSAIPRFTPLATSLPGQPGTTTYIDTNAIGAGPFFYRVGVGDWTMRKPFPKQTLVGAGQFAIAGTNDARSCNRTPGRPVGRSAVA